MSSTKTAFLFDKKNSHMLLPYSCPYYYCRSVVRGYSRKVKEDTLIKWTQKENEEKKIQNKWNLIPIQYTTKYC